MSLSKHFTILHQVNSLNEYTFNALLSENGQQNISSIIHLLQTLHRKKLLNSSNAQNIIDKLTQHLEMPGRVKDLVEVLETHNTLDKDTFNTLIKYIQSDIEQKNYLAQHKEYVAGYEKQNDPNAQEKDEFKHRINAEHFVFIKKIYGFFQAVHKLAENKLLNKNNFTFIARKDPAKRAEILWTLQKHNLLTKENLTVLNHCIDPTPVAEAMITLKKEGLLTAENWTLFQHAVNLIQIAEAICLLDNYPLLTEENWDPTQVAQAILFLGKKDLLQKENLNLFKKSRWVSSTEAAAMIQIFYEKNILTKENLKNINDQGDYPGLRNAVEILANNKILNQGNFDLITTKTNPQETAQMLSLLAKNKISRDKLSFLTQEDDQGKTHFQTLCTLDRAGMLNEKTLAILEIYASEFGTDAYYHCFELAKLLIQLKDHNVLTAENMTEIKNINPNDLWLTIAIINDLIQAKILNDSHCKAVITVITCPGLNLMAVKTKTKQLLKEGKLNTNNFTQLIKEIESNSSRASMTPASFFNSKHAANLSSDITKNEESMPKLQTPSII